MDLYKIIHELRTETMRIDKRIEALVAKSAKNSGAKGNSTKKPAKR